LVVTGVRHELLPLLALAYGLQESGFVLTVVTHAIHERLIRRYGFGFAALKGDPHSVMRSGAFQDAVFSEAHMKVGNLLNEANKHTLWDNMVQIHAACKHADAILCSIGVLTECSAVAQKYQIPVLLLPLLPYSPTGEIPLAQYFATPSKFAWLNRLTYELSGLLLWSSLGRTFNRFRTGVLQIGPQRGFVLEGVPQVAGFSDIVVPRPSDWAAAVNQTAFWSLPPAVSAAGIAALQPTLHKLLAVPRAEPATRPIFVGFESVPLPDPVGILRQLHALSQRLDVPVIFAAGATDMEAARTSPLLEGYDGIVFELPSVSAAAPLSSRSAPGSPVLGGAHSAAGGVGAVAGSGAGAMAAGSAAAAGSSAGAGADEYGDSDFGEHIAGLRRGGAGAGGSPPSPAAAAALATSAGAGGVEWTDASTARLAVLVVKDVPYDWVLPRCSLAVHCAGAGVTQAAFHAGIPSVCFPAFGEQFFWASRVSWLHVGAAAHPHLKHLHARLEEQILAAREAPVMARARALGEALRTRGDGVALAVAVIRDVLSRPQHRHCGIICAWTPDAGAAACSLCARSFSLTNRRRHCRSCGRIACHACLAARCHLPGYPETAPQIVCEPCLDGRRAFLASHIGQPAVPPIPAANGGPGPGASVGVPISIARARAGSTGMGGGGGGGGGASSGPGTLSLDAAGAGSVGSGSVRGGGGVGGTGASGAAGMGSLAVGGGYNGFADFHGLSDTLSVGGGGGGGGGSVISGGGAGASGRSVRASSRSRTARSPSVGRRVEGKVDRSGLAAYLSASPSSRGLAGPGAGSSGGAGGAAERSLSSSYAPAGGVGSMAAGSLSSGSGGLLASSLNAGGVYIGSDLSTSLGRGGGGVGSSAGSVRGGTPSRRKGGAGSTSLGGLPSTAVPSSAASAKSSRRGRKDGTTEGAEGGAAATPKPSVALTSPPPAFAEETV
jgi:UDP:flavonoid glycosyltransferase YjiC (YdhE family)